MGVRNWGKRAGVTIKKWHRETCRDGLVSMLIMVLVPRSYTCKKFHESIFAHTQAHAKQERSE